MKKIIWIIIATAIIGCADEPENPIVAEPKDNAEVAISADNIETEPIAEVIVDEILPSDDAKVISKAELNGLVKDIGHVKHTNPIGFKSVIKFMNDAKAHAKRNCGKHEVELPP